MTGHRRPSRVRPGDGYLYGLAVAAATVLARAAHTLAGMS